MFLTQLFVLIQRDVHVLHMLAQSLRVINMVNEWKYPINICTSNTDDNWVGKYCTVLISPSWLIWISVL